MQLEEYGAYLGRLDLWLAIGLAVLAAVVACGIYIFAQDAIDSLLSAIPQVGGRIGQANRNRHRAEGPEWICRTCRSINEPNSLWCYRGCGSRYRQEDARIDLETLFTDDRVGPPTDA